MSDEETKKNSADAPILHDMNRSTTATETALKPWEAPTFNGCEKCMIHACQCITFTPPCCICCIPSNLKVINDYERGVRLRLGKRLHKGTLSGGMHLIYPSIDTLLKIDCRERTLDIPAQSIVTKEGLAIQVDGVVYFKVVVAERALLGVSNVVKSIKMLAQTKLRETLGTKMFTEIQTDRENIADKLKTDLDLATDPWGVEVTRVELTDLKLPRTMERAMGSEAEAAVNAKAKVIEADGEVAAASRLAEAAALMEKSPAALQLRFLQTLSQISAENNSTVIMPFPSALLDGLSNIAKGSAMTTPQLGGI